MFGFYAGAHTRPHYIDHELVLRVGHLAAIFMHVDSIREPVPLATMLAPGHHAGGQGHRFGVFGRARADRAAGAEAGQSIWSRTTCFAPLPGTLRHRWFHLSPEYS